MSEGSPARAVAGDRPARRPGTLMALVAAGITAHGLAARLAGCGEVWVDDYGHVLWECGPPAGRADPKQVADLATVLLTGTGAGWPRLGSGYGRPGLTFKGIAGLELKARGFTVDLDICADEEVYEVTADIVVTNPGTAGPGSVRIGDDGALTWERDYWHGTVPLSARPGRPVPVPVCDPAGVAALIVETLVRAAPLCPGTAARRTRPGRTVPDPGSGRRYPA